MRELYRYVSGYLAQRIPDDPLSFEPELAQSIRASDDGLVYTVRLRKGVYWHTPQVDWASGWYAWPVGFMGCVWDAELVSAHETRVVPWACPMSFRLWPQGWRARVPDGRRRVPTAGGAGGLHIDRRKFGRFALVVSRRGLLSR